ncbi:MATE family efflux transporter [Blautia sp. HCP3S3_H10_1]|uniref:MATE family efflux transporter n=1 Tax=unclassified Blautia TaxID=2648079 RepID=UPI003F8FEB37|nr:MATE family efflux transporter [Clostridia bacterium]
MENELFEKTSVPKAYMKLALPVVLSMMVSLVYNMVDTYFIALTGVQELVAGVSLVVPIFTMMIAFGDIFGLGGSSVISRLFGEKREADAKRASAFCVWASVLFGVFVTVILLLFRSQILGILGADETTWQYAGDYYTWIVLGAVFIIFGLVPSNILRTEGLATQAMTGSILGSIVNIILDPVFIFGLKQGAAGAAIATVLGNVIADIYYVYAIRKKAKRLSVALTDVKIPGVMIRDIFTIGIPASITNLMQSFMVMMTNHFLLSYGTDKIAAMGIALKANMITTLILVGFAFGGQPLIGYNYGSGNQKRLKEILKFSYLFEMGLGLVFTVIMSAFAPMIISIFMNDPEIVNNGAMMLRFQQLGMTFMAVTLVSTCVCQSVGNALGAFTLSLSRQGVLYVIALLILSRIFGYTGVLVSQACADVVTAVIAVGIVRKILKVRR